MINFLPISNVFRLSSPMLRSTSLYTNSIRQLSILGNLKPSEGSTQGFKRLGRGPSSGKGKTSGRGQKGQKARGKVKPWFEGGQTPIYKLFPKIGFTNVNATPMNELNLERIQWFHDNGRLTTNENDVLDIKTMRDIGLVTGTIKHGVKILARGFEQFKIPIKIEASRASEGAIKAIESAGGDFTAKYFNKLGLRAHLNPDWFLMKRGRIPLLARPIKRRDIDYYSKDSKRGYLIKENHPMYQQIQMAKNSNTGNKSSKIGLAAKKSALERQLEELEKETKPFTSNFNSKIITLEEMKKRDL